ncbi:MAG: hypothetical protein ACRD1P_12395 [Thermoanaerobaculia bacterium]
MLSILVVAPANANLTRLGGRNPSVEVLHAHGPDDAVEKLARNRRIDAVLLLCGAENKRIMEAIREDIPAAPPIFLPESDQTPLPGTRLLSPGDPEELFDRLVRELEEGSATRGKVKV